MESGKVVKPPASENSLRRMGSFQAAAAGSLHEAFHTSGAASHNSQDAGMPDFTDWLPMVSLKL